MICELVVCEAGIESKISEEFRLNVLNLQNLHHLDTKNCQAFYLTKTYRRKSQILSKTAVLKR